MSNEDPSPCGAEHPRISGLLCERMVCVVYHQNGTVIWTEGAKPLPKKGTDPVAMAGLLHRTRVRSRNG